ncbi:uncharacterized protein A1O5_06520 [Cladophialophora psammophila CBS 110553]|uniref:Xylanolytic transcriptional activator regulatory domain-containing protein n=1 Tax=Cladophialophora psammophila CBS 110553 TaxID=1182543 RepID=W9X0L2_9EURO|nr:uncharacterized protein A1O5_06520 [Cladophialophora psammophila CBS 110553]EXJ70451.1 hypothetical protein A1O5_06520 [Cladophialophora psammophila CBS 110553]
MQNRLKHLESLVKVAMASQPSNGIDTSASNPHTPEIDPSSQCPTPTEIPGTFVEARGCAQDGVSNAAGQVVQGPNETTYIGATHWAAMLDDIEEVKGYFNQVVGETSQPDNSVGPDLSLVFKHDSPTSKESLLATLPDSAIVNRFIHRYFNSNSPALHIIHKPAFQRHYSKFWADPHGSPISWLALIYSIMAVATFSALGAGEEIMDTRGTPVEKIRAYRGYCAQCLMLTNYAQPGPYTLEAFLVYIEGELLLSKGDQINCYLIVSVAIRLAIRMGLHRDPDNVKGNLTPYRGEMRRRIWHLLLQMDLMVSFHLGLPSMVQAIKSDTRVPLNLRDQDFDEDTIELPPSRLETEMTGMSYTLAKGRIARISGKVVEQANLLTSPHYGQVMELDRELQQAFTAVPSFLRFVPIEFSVTDSPQLIIQRLSLAVLFHKSRCVLHRKYLTTEKENAEFSFSRKAAVDASMKLLMIQSEAHDAVQPGGPLSKDLWFISSISMHDLLLAGTIVYLSLIQQSDGITLKVGDLREATTQQAEMIIALERSYRIWTETKSMSVDTKKAYDVLGNMVKRVNSIFRHRSGDTVVSTEKNDAGYTHGRESLLRLSLNEPMPSLASSIGVTDLLIDGLYNESNSNRSASGLTMQSDIDEMNIPMDSLRAIIDTPTNFDWVFDVLVTGHLTNQANEPI